MKKAQWNYECECGFKVTHTIAKVELSEETMKELFTTGKTRNKISGFTSKAGNVFDTCLKYEDDQIKFDFNNPGETDPNAIYNNINLSPEERAMIDAHLKESEELQKNNESEENVNPEENKSPEGKEENGNSEDL